MDPSTFLAVLTGIAVLIVLGAMIAREIISGRSLHPDKQRRLEEAESRRILNERAPWES